MSAEDRALAQKVLTAALPGLMDNAGGEALMLPVEVVQAVDTLSGPPPSLPVLRITVVGDDLVAVGGEWEVVREGRSLVAREFLGGAPTTRELIFTHVASSA